MRQPVLLSFIIPMRNRKKTICYCLDSILSQEPVIPYEIIVVDDASTDGCDALVDAVRSDCTKLFKKIGGLSESNIRSRIRLFRHENHRGAAAARNTGIKEASGKYLWFVDSDDFIAQGALIALKDVLSSSNYDIIQFASKKLESLPPEYTIRSMSDRMEEVNVRDSHDLLLLLSSGSVWCRIFRREFVQNSRFDLTYLYSEDSQFSWRMTLKAKRIAFLHKPLYGYMSNSDSLTSIKSYDRFVCYVKVVEDYISAVNKSTISKYHRKKLLSECENRIYFHAFYTFSYSEITSEMWKAWYDIYYRVMVKGKNRSLFKRIASRFIWRLQSDKLIILISFVSTKIL